MFILRAATAFVCLVFIGACGSPSTAKPLAASSPTSPGSATQSLSPSPSAATTASSVPTGWVTYKEPAWGYSISMPANWHLVTAGERDPAQFRHFSFENVTDVLTLDGMDGDGMQMTVIVANLNDGCPGVQPPVGWSQSTVPAVAINIDGYRSVVSGNGGSGTDSSLWIVGSAAATSKYCYLFSGVTLNHEAQVKWTPLFEQMLSTFRFGTPIAPPF
jgi:hypothetical protein